jgi:DNA-binding FadR family transcriptional regulator
VVILADQLDIVPLRIPQLYEHIVARLRREIGSGVLAPGSKLPSERDLAQALGVSRPSVREAIGALQNAGLVETRAGAGSFVAADALERLDDSVDGDADTSVLALLEAREAVEPQVAALAARRGRPDARAEALLDAMDEAAALQDAAQSARWREADRLFHRQLAAMTANPLLARMGEVIAETMDQPLWRRLHDTAVTDPARARIFAAEHRLIYEAVVTGDAEAAALYAGRHVSRVRHQITDDQE